jgi:hypothetical protein
VLCILAEGKGKRRADRQNLSVGISDLLLACPDVVEGSTSDLLELSDGIPLGPYMAIANELRGVVHQGHALAGMLSTRQTAQERLAGGHGEAHLALCLRLIVETGNGGVHSVNFLCVVAACPRHLFALLARRPLQVHSGSRIGDFGQLVRGPFDGPVRSIDELRRLRFRSPERFCLLPEMWCQAAKSLLWMRLSMPARLCLLPQMRRPDRHRKRCREPCNKPGRFGACGQG